MQDLRYALRWLRRSPGFTAVAVVSLALGIGFNTALFSVVDALLFRPLPVADPDRLVEVYTSSSDGDVYATSSYPDFLDFKAENQVFSDMVAYTPMFAAMNLTDRSKLVLGEIVTGNYFQMLGVSAAAGRTLLPEDDDPRAERVVMISHRMWMRDHGGDPAAVGQTIRLRGQPYTIVGVTPGRFTGMVPMLAPELWLPLVRVGEVEPAGIQDAVPSPTGTSRLDRRGQRWLFVKGRLRGGVTPAQAGANLDVLWTQIAAEHVVTNKDRRITVKPTREVRVHPQGDGAIRSMGVGLMIAVGLVLLIACANVASMLLARATARQREISIRLAIGASRGRLVRQLLTESLLLALLGAGAGLLLASALVRWVATIDLPIPIPIALDLRLDARVFLFTAGVSLLAGIIAGLAPALRASRGSLTSALRGEGVGTEWGGRRWSLRDGLVAGQMAGTVVLLVMAALLTRSLMAAHATDPGFRVDGIAVISTDVDVLGYEREQSRLFWDRAVDRIAAIPGVEAVALASRLPFSLNFNQDTVFIPGRHGPGDRGDTIMSARVSDGYFKALGVAILEGRGFDAADTPESPAVVVVSQAMASRYWPEESAIGRRIHLRGLDGPAFEVVGIAADHAVQRVGESPRPYVHFAQAQRPDTYRVLMARTRGNAGVLLAQVRRELLAMEPNLVFLDNQTMEDQVGATLLPVRAGAWVVSVVGLVAMLLAAIGLYGVIAYSVARRTREIGIRMALGAQPSRVLSLILRQGLVVTAAGLVAGGVLAALAARAAGGMLYGLGAADPLAWVGAIGLMVAAAVAANLVPARRAARVEPTVALRME
jgi:macrolide transport system ATP-binding/permease protein